MPLGSANTSRSLTRMSYFNSISIERVKGGGIVASQRMESSAIARHVRKITPKDTSAGI
jgi:hypothetical protein